jgi:hypothetical protein
MIGTIKEIGVVDGAVEVVVLLSGGAEKTAILHSVAGLDTYPIPGDIVTLKDIGGDYVVDSVYVPPDNGTSPGETLLFSRGADGAIRATMKATADAVLILNDGTEPAVRGDLLKSQYDAHVHATAFGPSGAPAVALVPDTLNDTVLL